MLSMPQVFEQSLFLFSKQPKQLLFWHLFCFFQKFCSFFSYFPLPYPLPAKIFLSPSLDYFLIPPSLEQKSGPPSLKIWPCRRQIDQNVVCPKVLCRKYSLSQMSYGKKAVCLQCSMSQMQYVAKAVWQRQSGWRQNDEGRMTYSRCLGLNQKSYFLERSYNLIFYNFCFLKFFDKDNRLLS